MSGGKSTTTLLSWNVERPSSKRVEPVIAAILERQPDILTLQEANLGVLDRLAEEGWTHQVCHLRGGYPRGRLDIELKHGAAIVSKAELRADLAWTADAAYSGLFARASVSTPDGELDVVTAHIPNGDGNGWVKASHLQLLGRALRDGPPTTRVLTGDFNEPQTVLADGRVVSFAASVRKNGTLNVDGEVTEGTENLPGPHTWREWDRAVVDFFSPAYLGLTHVLERTRGSLLPMPVTHEAGKSPRFFDHAFVSADLEVAVEYIHELRTGVSDHSGVWLQLRRREAQAPDTWEPA